MDLRFTAQDHTLLQRREMDPDLIRQQINFFKEGLAHVQLDRPCTVNDGILQIRDAVKKELLELHQQAADSGRITKFVPASGAATRMFKTLLTALKHLEEGQSGNSHLPPEVSRFVDNLPAFAFGAQLKHACGDNHDPATILRTLLSPDGFGFAALPKGLIPFHQYSNGSRTAFEEHLVEAAAYARDAQGVARLHFTVAAQYRRQIDTFIRDVQSRYTAPGMQFDISYSEQHPSTDTIAVTLDNQPLRDHEGHLVFRPGGHGALLRNLQSLNGDIVFIKNIDNVVPDRLKESTILYKKLLAGLLVKLQQQIFRFLQLIEKDQADREVLLDALDFLRSELYLAVSVDVDKMDNQQLGEFLFQRLNRPLRICGMVKNEGEPGGGPFWVQGEMKESTAQIVESAQVNLNDAVQKQIWENGSYFNPVDLVCALKDYRGQPFDLTAFRNPRSGFISVKSFEGHDIKALELPGLWNGAMAYWNTLFVEVPIATFNPVKTVFDLLRPEHQSNVPQ